MNFSPMILCRHVSLQPAGWPFHRYSPVQNCLKFSAVLGQISLKSSNVTLPIFCLFACRSKKTTGFSLLRIIPAISYNINIIMQLSFWKGPINALNPGLKAKRMLVLYNYPFNKSINYTVGLMDNFFAKKGLTLSRNNNGHVQKNGDYLLRTNQQVGRVLQFEASIPQKYSVQKYPQLQNTNARSSNNTQPNYQSLIVQREQKSSSVGPSIRLLANKDAAANGHPPLPKQSNWKYVPNYQTKPKNQVTELNQLNTLSSNDPVNRSFEENAFIVERLSHGEHCTTQSDAKSLNKMKISIQPYRTESESPNKINKNHQYLYSSPVRSRQHSQERRGNIYGEGNSNEKILNQRIARLQREKDQLMGELRKKDGKYVPQEWFEEKYKLIKEINEKNIAIRELQTKISNQQKQAKTKINSLQFQIRMLQGSKSRLQTENEKISKLYQGQRAKNEKAKDQINKLIFFEDDLIHAKDYSHLKEQLQQVLTQNAKMFQDHQKYIIEVGESRRTLSNKLEEVQGQLSKLRNQFKTYKQTIQRFTESGDDKMLIIKLQNENNFIRKKNEQSIETIILKQKQLQQAKVAMKELIEKQNQKDQSSQKYMEEMNMWQIKDTIAMYEARISDLNEIVASKHLQLEEQKKEIQCLATEIRNYKEDKQINDKKQKIHQNSLKNEVENLQRTLQMQIQFKNKKIANLQQFLQRKSKEINEKDKFIKTFLITRLKTLDNSSIQLILQELKNHFEGGQIEHTQGK